MIDCFFSVVLFLFPTSRSGSGVSLVASHRDSCFRILKGGEGSSEAEESVVISTQGLPCQPSKPPQPFVTFCEGVRAPQALMC